MDSGTRDDKSKVFITANDVSRGKPSPKGYLEAFNR